MKKIIYLLMSLSFVAFASCSDDDKENPSSGNGENGGDSNGNVSAVSVYKSGTENGHDYVDLGLTSGTKWATCNVGATTPQDSGNYYAWGEVTEKETYNWSTYLDGKISSKFDWGTDKDLLKGVVDIAGTQYDAAKANWGGKWRMPTKAQQNELRNECYWVWTNNYNGSNVSGFIVYKAKKSSHKGKCCGSLAVAEKSVEKSYSLSDSHIFLPTAGRQSGDYLQEGGHYWSSSLSSNYTYENACDISFYFYDEYIKDHECSRPVGQSVRAVCLAE